MVHLLRILLDIRILWAAMFISLLLDLILLTQFIFYKSFCECSYLYSFWPFALCWDTWEHHLNACSMLVIVCFNFMLIQTPLGQVLLRITALSHAIAFFLVLLLLHGSPRNKLLSLALVPKQNFEHWLLPLQRLYGFDGYSLILVYLVMHPHLFCAITLEPYKLPMTLSNMSLLSILVLMPFSLVLTVIRRQLIFSMYPLSCNWLIFSRKPKLESNIGFIWSNSMLQILRFHLEFEGGC